MLVWLTFNNNKEFLLLPVTPAEFSVSMAQENSTVSILSVGEVSKIGKRKLKEISFESFFPKKEYAFTVKANSELPKPYDCVNQIETWKESGRPIRIVITETNINMPVTIESFEYKEKDGSGDVYFSISLREYVFLNAKKINTLTVNQVNRETKETEEGTKVLVKSGDTLWKIAHKYLGDGERWREIADKNNIKDPRKLKVGQELIL